MRLASRSMARATGDQVRAGATAVIGAGAVTVEESNEGDMMAVYGTRSYCKYLTRDTDWAECICGYFSYPCDMVRYAAYWETSGCNPRCCHWDGLMIQSYWHATERALHAQTEHRRHSTAGRANAKSMDACHASTANLLRAEGRTRA